MAQVKKFGLPPRPTRSCALVVKQAWEWSSRFHNWLVPSLFVYGNRRGFAWLSDYFAYLAGSINEDGAFENDFHAHLEHDAPLNRDLSDAVGLKLVCMAARHQTRILKSLGIEKQAKLEGSPIAQWARILNHIVARALRTMNTQDRVRLAEEIRLLIDESEDCVAVLLGKEQTTRCGGRDQAKRRSRRPRNKGLFGFSLKDVDTRPG
jgi:hypothetical protein